MLKLPYAIRDFNKLISQEYVYLDRTDRIPIMESLGYELLFLRPRRFGKSLWLSTLMNYYDLAKADHFERLFGHLAVGQNPTPLHNQYLVMKWDFSTVESQGTIQEIRTSLYNHINEQIAIFGDDYQTLLPGSLRINPTDALASFNSAVAAARHSGHKLYLFIDEYDNFANEIMMGRVGRDRDRYHDLVSGEGLLKTLFKNLKTAGSGAGLDRVFMTGVSPIVMNDITSGANVTKNITWHPHLNDLCGFREAEVSHLVQQVVEACGLPAEKGAEALEQMRLFYDGSRFITRFPGGDIDQAPRVYNPTSTFYFLEELQEFCLYPENMLDSNLAPDYHKLVYISSHAKGEDLLLDALNEETTVTLTGLAERWGVEEMLEPDKQRERLAALLCYLGALTVTGKTATAEVILEIPNLVMRKLYAERILELTFKTADERDEGHDAARRLFAQGELGPLCAFVEKHLLSVYSNRDYRHFNELTLKTLFLALLHYNNLYIMDSEPALQRRYGDLIMIIRPEMRQYSVFDLLIEFKYVPLKGLTAEGGRLTGDAVAAKSEADLAGLSAVQEAFSQAQAQLEAYRQTLTRKYGPALKLRTYTVVAVGFERLLWVEVSG